jgi:hypothetical protein
VQQLGAYMMVSNPTAKQPLSVAVPRDILLRPVPIPETSPERYISFKQALNLCYPDEDTGDWHFESTFFDRADRPPQQLLIPLAGMGESVDTTPALGQRGIQDMSTIMVQQQLLVPKNQPVYVANHYRAIADLVMLELQEVRVPSYATNREINSWLDTAEQIEHLKQNYLELLATQLSGQALAVFKQWISTVEFYDRLLCLS